MDRFKSVAKYLLPCVLGASVVGGIWFFTTDPPKHDHKVLTFNCEVCGQIFNASVAAIVSAMK